MPAVRNTREAMTASPAPMRLTRGTTSWAMRLRISCGTPGSMTTSPGSPSSHNPGALPQWLVSTVAPRGTSAWQRLLSGERRMSPA